MKPLINKKFKLEKFPGKGGWTFARIPGVDRNVKRKFGWVKVRGTIDGYEIKKHSLAPMGDGSLFLPVRAEIRKKIHKQAGDMIHVVLYRDDEPMQAPEEMMECLRDEPKALKFFNSLSESEQKQYVDWIYSAKKEETKIDRLAETVNRLLAGLRKFDPK